MLKKLIFKRFSSYSSSSTFGKKIKSLSNINQLINYINISNDSLNSEDYIETINKFKELEVNEPNSDIKFYELLDYITIDEARLKNIQLMKLILQNMLSNNLLNKQYWDYFFNNLINKNLIGFSENYNYIEILKLYSNTKLFCKDNNTWNVFEELFMEIKSNLKLSDIKVIIIHFLNNGQGTNEFYKYCFTNYEELVVDLKKDEEFALNLLCGFANYFYLNNSGSENKSKSESKPNIKDVNDYLLSVFDKVLISYGDFNFGLLNKLHNQLKIITKLNKIKKYSNISQNNCNIIKSQLEKLNTNIQNTLTKKKFIFKSNDDSNTMEYFIQILEDSIQDNETILNDNLVTNVLYNNYSEFGINDLITVIIYIRKFIDNIVEKEEFKKLIENEEVWEIIYENIHKVDLNTTIQVAEILKYFKLANLRLWICIQISLKSLLNSCNELETFNKLLSIFDDETRNESHVLTPFVYFLRDRSKKLDILQSHRNNGQINI